MPAILELRAAQGQALQRRLHPLLQELGSVTALQEKTYGIMTSAPLWRVVIPPGVSPELEHQRLLWLHRFDRTTMRSHLTRIWTPDWLRRSHHVTRTNEEGDSVRCISCCRIFPRADGRQITDLAEYRRLEPRRSNLPTIDHAMPA